jgi:hypothetical protein
MSVIYKLTYMGNKSTGVEIGYVQVKMLMP